MRRHAKAKSSATRQLARKTVTSASVAARNFPAWIDSGETSVTFLATRTATPRVRAGLVLRPVAKAQTIERRVPNGSAAR